MTLSQVKTNRMDALPPMGTISALLTPSETHAIQSFLNTIQDAQDWNVDVDRQALAKATKDLMSLETPFSYSPENIYPPHLSLLPPPPDSDSSSRTPTPTSAPPLSASRHPNRARHASTSYPYPSSTSTRPSRSQSVISTSSLSNDILTQPNRSHSSQPNSTSPQSHQKPALLSASQKKANHIQSEQKRRANIRRGYEALCECVPVLREAIRLEEEANTHYSTGRSVSVSKCKKGKGVSKSGKDLEEKLDGRAGPRSENVVLSKCWLLSPCTSLLVIFDTILRTAIDYINELLDERGVLLERLRYARRMLPPNHSAPLNPEEGPLWEREWQGGCGEFEGDGEESS